MQVRVLFFGILRDSFGAAEQPIELPEGSRAGDLVDLLAGLQASSAPALAALWPRIAVAVNRQYAPRTQPLGPGDEVALLPPVSGGAPGPASPAAKPVLLTPDPLDPTAALARIKAGPDGAVVVFDGIVRDNTRGRRTLYLHYHAYEAMALDQMREMVAEALARFPVREALLHHRLGRLEIGETSVLIAVASAHRGAAFEACRWIIDTLKKTVPIWKQEFFADGAVWADGEAFPPELSPGA